MTALLKKLFSPILNHFENGEGVYNYKKSHRTILIVVGCLFCILSGLLLAVTLFTSKFAALFPCAIFAGAAVVCLVVGCLGSDQAVATLWKNR